MERDQKMLDKLPELMAQLTPSQHKFLLERVKDRHRSDKETALAIGLHPNTVYNWRSLSATFRAAEQALGRAQLRAVQDAWREHALAQFRAGTSRKFAKGVES